jgi:hypothetical protein
MAVVNQAAGEGNTTGSSTGQTNYPVDLLSQAAARILVDANQALDQHQTLWNQVQAFLHEHDIDGKMAAVLIPHEQRMRESYNWQIQLASSIFSAIELATAADDSVASSFKPQPDHSRGHFS